MSVITKSTIVGMKPARNKTDVISILRAPDLASPDTIEGIIAAVSTGEFTLQESMALVGTIVLVAPELGQHVPLSFLDDCLTIADYWKSLVLIMLHSNAGKSVCEWLHSKWAERQALDSMDFLGQHICDWFPDWTTAEVFNASDLPFVSTLAFRQNNRSGHRDDASHSTNELLNAIFNKEGARILVIHNIVDGQGDEMVRTFALLQALLDGFPKLRIVLFTDRSYLYGHPRIETLSIFDSGALAALMDQRWDGVIDFFEPYLSANSYNVRAHELISSHVRMHHPHFFIWARKNVNHFVYESVSIGGKEFASEFGVKSRLIPLNYECTSRLIAHLGLPSRFAEETPIAGFIGQTTSSVPHFEDSWDALKQRLAIEGSSRIAVVNVFGGRNAMKGFQLDARDRAASILRCLIEEGFGVVMVSNGTAWGGSAAIEEVCARLTESVRTKLVTAPILPNPQENMRQLKYFVAFSDLVVTVEGWMMHLAYSLGKPYRLLMAPYSYPAEWHPHLRTPRQWIWNAPVQRAFNSDSLTQAWLSPATPSAVHHPEKLMLARAVHLWELLPAETVEDLFVYWMRSNDKDIRKSVTTARGKIDAGRFSEDLLNTLSDPNHQVRAAAATALLHSKLDLSDRLSADWQSVLRAYQLIGEFRFRDAGALGKPAEAALRACESGDEDEVKRDARVVLNAMLAE